MRGRPATAGVAIMLGAALLTACSSDGESAASETSGALSTTTSSAPAASSTSQPPTTQATTPAPTDVEVAIECTRGDRLSAVPFDAGRVGFLTDVPDETPWVIQTVTITNNSSEGALVASGFPVRYLAADGSLLGEAGFPEPFAPAFWAAPGQTIVRSSFNFSSVGVPTLPLSFAAKLYEGLASCEVGDGVEVDAVGPEGFIDEELAPGAELLRCGPDQTSDRFEAAYSLVNPLADTIVVDLAFEILDDDGNRLGIGGNVGDGIEPGEEAEILGWAAFFTVADFERATMCSLLALSARE